ncbi:MAG: hypothetical protein HYZ26_08280 [Chloroflexi bacterium]|nr:hypothetical protein [Chloroflexota bacterium]
MSTTHKICPACGSDEFVSTPNRYDVLAFEESKFEVVDSHFTDEETVTCRECGEVVDIEESERQGKIVLKVLTP